MQIVYGDGSGYHQRVRELRRASWAVVTMDAADEHEPPPTRSRLRGGIGGWFPTVPRGELSALTALLRHAGPGATFVTDCQAVADGVRACVPATLTAASCVNADLWRAVSAGLRDRDEPAAIVKTKAHRSRAAARRDAVDHEGHWWGNGAADSHAKQLAYSMVVEPNLELQWSRHRSMVTAAVKRAAAGTAWALGRWPTLERRRERCLPEGPDDGEQETGHILRRRPDGAVECTLCKQYARCEDRAARRFRREICAGSIYNRIDETHSLRVSSGVTWCSRCGGFSSRWLRSLLEPCRGRPLTATRRNILRRLNAGPAAHDPDLPAGRYPGQGSPWRRPRSPGNNGLGSGGRAAADGAKRRGCGLPPCRTPADWHLQAAAGPP